MMQIVRRDLALPVVPDRIAFILTFFTALVLYITTVQRGVNLSTHPYLVDVGEIQNALPRWGTLHFPGYPLYSLTGSIFVTLLRLLGLAPATAVSLYSAVWGAFTAAMIVPLARLYRAPALVGVVAGLLLAVATSIWVDASIAEVHTMTLGLMSLALYFGIRFGRTGRRSDWLWLTFWAIQAILHQRALIFMAPGLLVLVAQQWRRAWKDILPAIGVALLASLVYLYLPIRDWLGATWIFNDPGSWDGFWGLVFDTKTGRIIELPTTLSEWRSRATVLYGVLNAEWPWLLLLIGLGGLLAGTARRSRTEAIALTLLWIPYPLLSLFIWVGRIADAQLATNLPVLPLAALGIALLTAWFYDKAHFAGIGLTVLWLVMVGWLITRNRPTVLAVTQESAVQEVLEQVKRLEFLDDGPAVTLMALWGHRYWALAYQQEYEGALPGVNLVDHNADLNAVLDRGDRLITLSRTFYERDPGWWAEKYDASHFSSPAPGSVEISRSPLIENDPKPLPSGSQIGADVQIRSASLEWDDGDMLLLSVDWQAMGSQRPDYSVAVHLVAVDPPSGPDDILAQADSVHPLSGWYPTSLWRENEVVRDHYLLRVPPDSQPAAVRIALYRQDESGTFQNSEWLTLPLP